MRSSKKLGSTYWEVYGKTGGDWQFVSEHRTLKAAAASARRERRRGCLPGYPGWPVRIVRCRVYSGWD